jgi:lipooligosaccharide transport system permease protein
MSTTMTLRAFEYWRYQYRRTWRGTVVTSVLNPVLYLAAMGVGLGSIVKSSQSNGLGATSYLHFIAPALVASTAFQAALFESMWPVMASIKWIKTYHAMLASPLGTDDVLHGHLLWVGTRVLQTSSIFLLIGSFFGGFGSLTALACVPFALLLGIAVATPMIAFAAHTDNEANFVAIQRFGIIPMFLFSGTFYPVSQLPLPLEAVAWLSPLFHGVELCRDAALDRLELLPTLGHIGYLAAFAVVGLLLAQRSYRKRLAP